MAHLRLGSVAKLQLVLAFSCCEIVSADPLWISGGCTAPDTVVLTPQTPSITVNLACQQLNLPPDHHLVQFGGSTQVIMGPDSWLTFQNVTSHQVAVGSYAGLDSFPGPLPDGSVFPYRLNPYGGGSVLPSVLAPGQSHTETFPAGQDTHVNVFGYYPFADIINPAPFLGTGTYEIPLRFFVATSGGFFSGRPNQFATGELQVVDYRLAINLGPWPGGNWVRYGYEVPEPASIGMTALGGAFLTLILSTRACRRLPRRRRE